MKMGSVSLYISLIFISSSFISLANSLSFVLTPGQAKCLKEEVHKDVLVTGEYKLSEAPNQKTHLKVGTACLVFFFCRHVLLHASLGIHFSGC